MGSRRAFSRTLAAVWTPSGRVGDWLESVRRQAGPDEAVMPSYLLYSNLQLWNTQLTRQHRQGNPMSNGAYLCKRSDSVRRTHWTGSPDMMTTAHRIQLGLHAIALPAPVSITMPTWWSFCEPTQRIQARMDVIPFSAVRTDANA